MSRKYDKTRVTLHFPAGRPIQLRYFCPVRRRFVKESAGTYLEREAEQRRRTKEAELLTGAYQHRPDAPWDVFKEAYRESEYQFLRESSQSKLDVVFRSLEKIAKPRVVADLTADVLLNFRTVFGRGADLPKDKRRIRSPFTVRSYMVDVGKILKWAELNGYIDRAPVLSKLRGVPKSAMKGRPISLEEFERMVNVTPAVVGADAAGSWQFLLRGLWFSGLRLDEAMTFDWGKEDRIHPVWPRRGHPTIVFPPSEQKNGEFDEIPMLPELEALLLSVPPGRRTGFIFEPASMNAKYGRAPRVGRPSTDWVGKVISRIGAKAGVVTVPAKGGSAAKCATAHDLRRSCAQRLEDAGLSPLLIARIMRHKSYETTQRHYTKGSTQKQAESIRALLDTLPVTVDDNASSQNAATR